MDCKRFRRLLDAAREGGLTEEDRAWMNAHSAGCARCRLARMVREDCLTLDDESELPESFRAAWREAIKNEENRGAEKKRARAPKWIAAAAALALLAAGAATIGRNVPSRATPAKLAGDSADAVGMSDALMPAAAFPPSPEAEQMRAAAPLAREEGAADTLAAAEIVRTASLSVSTERFDEDLEAVKKQLRDAGGRVESLEVSADADGLRYASLVMRVPAEELDVFVTSFQPAGRQVSVSQTAVDVTESRLDVQLRLQALQAKMERLNELLKKAATIAESIEVENSIADTRYLIDSYTASLRDTDSKTELAAVRLSLREESGALRAEVRELSLRERVITGVRGAWNDTRLFFHDLVVFLAIILPYAAAAAFAALIVIKTIRRRKK